MITVRAGSAAIGICLLLLASGCSREQQDWRSAESADTIEAYGRFIQRHPESELAAQARTRIVQLGEDLDWEHAGSADTVDAYRQFIAEHPNGKWAQEARIRIENFSLGEQAGTDAASRGGVGVSPPATPKPGIPAPAASVRATAAPALPAPFAPTPAAPTPVTPPPSPVTVTPPSPSARASGFGIQLGAFSTEAGADSEWRLLTGRFGPELQGLHEHVTPVDGVAGRMYRLQAAVGDEARARAICGALRSRGQGCVAVLPN